MGVGNYLIEDLSGTGKTSVCGELQRRGYHAIHGDRELAAPIAHVVDEMLRHIESRYRLSGA